MNSNGRTFAASPETVSTQFATRSLVTLSLSAPSAIKRVTVPRSVTKKTTRQAQCAVLVTAAPRMRRLTRILFRLMKMVQYLIHLKMMQAAENLMMIVMGGGSFEICLRHRRSNRRRAGLRRTMECTMWQPTPRDHAQDHWR